MKYAPFRCLLCPSCSGVYLVPYGPLEAYSARRAIEWLREHSCRGAS